jgi:TolA-binding protein
MPRTTAALAVVVLLSLSLRAASAVVDVGDRPELKLNAMDGTKIDLAAQRGKLVLIDFWSGKSQANRQAQTKILQAYNDHKDKGLVVFGINCDKKLTAAKENIASLALPWPHYHEREGWSGGIAAKWGVPKVPYYVLVAPDGAVVFAGSTTKIDDVIYDELLKHPPLPVTPDLVIQASADLESVDLALGAGKPAEAIQKFNHIPDEAKKDPVIAKHWDKTRKIVDHAAEQLLAEVETMITAKEYAKASNRLRSLATTFTGTAYEEKARKRLVEVMNLPEARIAVEQSQREAVADAALTIARKSRDGGDHNSAYTQFKSVAEDFPGTQGARTATDAVKAYEQDASFMRKLKDNTVGAKARSMMSLAESYRINGREDLARKKYEQVITDYPGTTSAEEAKKALQELRAPSTTKPAPATKP